MTPLGDSTADAAITNLPGALPVPTTDRWQPLRLGIRNIWQYDRTEFRFHRGRLILQGPNGAGKTKVLELSLPFLLDPDPAPQKLSPSEAAARTMWWNLIEPRSDGSSTFTSKEGFVWLEFGRRQPDGDRYFTIGARLGAKANNKTVKAAFFHSSRRVGSDLLLSTERADGQERALSLSELRDAIGESGSVTESRNEHRVAVDGALFGLGSRYDGLIALLRALRRPKLSEKLKLPELKAYLTDALPPVADDVIERQAEVFDGLRQDEAELAEAKKASERVNRFLRTYENYARRAAAEAASAVRASEEAVRTTRDEIRRTSDLVTASELAVAAHREREQRLEDEVVELAGRLDALRRTPEMIQARAIADATRVADSAEGRARTDATRAEQAAKSSERAASEAGQLRARAAEVDARRLEQADRLRLDAVRLDLLRTLERVSTATDEARARSVLDQAGASRRGELVAVRQRARARDEANRVYEDAEARRVTTEAAVSAADAEVTSAERERNEARAALEAALTHWASSASQLELDELGLRELIDAGDGSGRLRRLVDLRAQPLREQRILGAREAELESERLTAEIREQVGQGLALRRAEIVRPDPNPVLPGPREQRVGAPFYDLVDFAPSLSDEERAGLEAALTAAGLLDAWVDPSGTVLASDVFDASVLGQATVSDRTLADVLTPVGDRVPPARLRRVLASIGLGPSGARTWVGTDGSFQIGERAGRAMKAAAAFVGAEARRQERLRAWRRLRRTVSDLSARRARLRLAIHHERARLAALNAELEKLPREDALESANRVVDAAAVRAQSKRGELEVAAAGAAAGAAAAEAAAAALLIAAKRARVDAEADIDELIEALTRFLAEARRLIDLVRDSRAAAELARDRRRDASDLAQAATRDKEVADASRTEAIALRATAQELSAAASDDARTIVAREAQLVQEQRAKADEGKHVRAAGQKLQGEHAEARVRRDNAAAAEQPALDDRDQAAAAFGRFAESGLLALAISITDERPAASWTQTDALEIARRVDTGDPETYSRASVNAAAGQVQNGLKLLQAELPAHDFGSTISDDGYHVVSGRVGDDLLPIGQLAPVLAEDIRIREGAFAEQHREAARRFLLEGAGDALSARIREARRLVEETSIELRRHETASGRHLRLRWLASPEMPPETERVIGLLQRHPGDLREEDRLVIIGFLRSRIEAATGRADEVGFAAALEEELDYRRWHIFRLERFDGHRYDELTPRTFSAGSEGERAVELHLPLFAAAAAFYDSARAGAPRLVILDEAFSGIDEEMRSSLFGITSSFGLDLLITSPDEWGTYPTVDGASIYLLRREPDGGPRGVLARRFVWTGKERLDEQAIAQLGVG